MVVWGCVVKVALYMRVSTEDQHIDNQRPSLVAMAAQRGHEVVGEYVDEGVSGTKLERPGLDRLMREAAQGKFGAVLVWAVDRFARDGSFSGGLRLMGQLEHCGVKLVSYQETWLDTTGPLAGPIAHLVLKLAEEERERTRRRAAEGRARVKHQLKERGFIVSRSGQVRHSLGRPGKTPPEPTVAAAVELRRQGKSWRAVCAGLAHMRAGEFEAATIRRAVLSRCGGKDPKAAPDAVCEGAAKG